MIQYIYGLVLDLIKTANIQKQNLLLILRDYHVSNGSVLISVMNNIVCFYHSHLNKTTTYEDPRKDWTEEPPQPRQVELTRHQELGFGFVAGSEKPVIVRYSFKGRFIFSVDS